MQVASFQNPGWVGVLGSAGAFAFYNRHRGNLEPTNSGANAFYAARPNSSWETTLKINLTCSQATSVRISWGDAAGTSALYALATGANTISFQYTNAYDTQPDPANPAGTSTLATNYAREKLVTVTFTNAGRVSSVGFNRAEVTRFAGAGLVDTTVTAVYLGGQLLENLPVFPATLQILSYGLDVPGVVNQQGGNKVPFSSVAQATALCRNTLKQLISGYVGTSSAQIVSQNVASTQVFDLSLFPNLEDAYIQASGNVQTIVTTANTKLLRIVSQTPLLTYPAVDLSQQYIPPTVREVRYGSTNAGRADQTITPLLLQTARDIVYVDLAYSFATGNNTQGYTAAQFRDAFYQTVVNLWQNRANHAGTGKTATFAGNGSVSVATTAYPLGVTTYITDLMAAGWTITYTM